MPALVLTLLKLIFLALIYLFVWQIARALVRYLGVSEPEEGETGRGPTGGGQVRLPSPDWM